MTGRVVRTKKQEQRVLMIDLETSFNIGTFWRPGYNLSISHNNILEERQIIMASYKWLGEKKVHNLCWDVNLKSSKYIKGCDKKLVKELIKVIDQADLIVGQNHERFDIPWLRSRAMFHKIKMGHTYQTFDTLKKTRRYLNMNSNRLDYLGEFTLQEGKLATGGFSLWQDVIINNCPKALKKMVKYCNQDVLLLEKYYKRLLPYVTTNSHEGVYKGNEKWSCPTCGSSHVRLKKEYFTKSGVPRFGMTCKEGHNWVLSGRDYAKFVKRDK